MAEALQYIVNGIVSGSVYVLVALGLTLVFGVLRVPNFAHGVFVMLGAYLTYFLVQGGLSLLAAVPVVAIVMAAGGVVAERGVFRPLRDGGELALMLAAFALFQLIQNVAVQQWGGDFSRGVEFPVGGAIHLGGVVLTYQRLIILVAALLITVGLAAIVVRTRFGRAVRAVAEDPDSARLSGINVERLHVVVFAIATALAGLAGLALASLVPITPFMGDQPLLIAFAIIVLGGMGSVGGTAVAGIGIGVLGSLVTGFASAPVSDGVVFAVIVVILVARPGGVWKAASA